MISFDFSDSVEEICYKIVSFIILIKICQSYNESLINHKNMQIKTIILLISPETPQSSFQIQTVA